MVGVLVLTHLIVPDPKGPISGKGGTHHRIACDDRRAYLATATNLEAATDNASVANCPQCLAAAEKMGLLKNTGKRLLYPSEVKPKADKPPSPILTD